MVKEGKQTVTASTKEDIDTELSAYLAELGSRVRAARARRGMARRILARDSGVSERYLAQLEGGTGNPSITVLRQIATAVDYPLAELITGEGSIPLTMADGSRAELAALIAQLPEPMIPALKDELTQRLSQLSREGKGRRIALIGLRGAGKSTLGKSLAERLSVPFIELNRLVEQEYGGSVGEILALSGQAAFRRIERRCLERAVVDNAAAVIATGGGIVSEPETYGMLLKRCHTVWLRAEPRDYMSRVIAQGDLRPMARNEEAMDDLKAILDARDPDYRRADAILETSGSSEKESTDALAKLAGQFIGKPA